MSVLPSLDPYKIGYLDPARIKIAIVPVGKIKKKSFKNFIEIISENDILDLEKIPFVEQENGVVNNKKPDGGKVLLKYVTSHNIEHGRYEDIQPFRRIFGVIGIIDCEQEQDIQKEYQKFKKLISKKFSTILSRVCFAHNPSEEQKKELLSIEPVQFFTDNESFKTRFNEVLVQLISNIITRFDTLINDIKKLQIIHSPKPNNPTARDQKDYNTNPIPNSMMNPKKEPSNFPVLPPSVYVSGTAREISQNSQTVETSSPTVLTNPSLQNVVGMLADSRARKLTASRSQKLASDLLLLAGRVSEATKNYANILETMKNNNDYLWQAVCLESYQCALFLEALQNNKNIIKIKKDNSTETQDLQYDTLTSYEHFRTTGLTIYHTNIKLKTLICELPERTREIISLYDRVSNTEDKPAYPFLAITSCLRIAKLLSIMHNIRLNSSFLSGASIQLNSNRRISSPTLNADTNVNIVEPINGVSKIAVASWLNKAWHGGLQFLSENLKIDICASISAIYGSIGMLRKHAFFLHQTDLMTVTYIRNLTQKNLTKNKDTSSPSSPISPSRSRVGSVDGLNDDTEDNDRFIAYPSGELMERVCEVIGIGESLRTTPLLVPYKDDLVWEMRKDDLKKKEALKWNNRQSSQAPSGKPIFEDLHFGWPELQIFMMKQCLEMSLISEDFQKTISFSGRLLRRLHSYLIPSRQKEIADLLCYVLQRRQIELLHQQKTESSKKQEVQNHYSKLQLSEAGFSIASSLIILDSIDVSEYLPKRIPYPYHKYKNDENEDDSPFIYSPFVLRKAKSDNMLNKNGVNEKMLMVANEPIEFIVTFTNTYSFDIEIEGLTIKTSGIKVKSVPVSVIIPAFTRYYQVKIFATPLEAGTLRVLGCQIKMFGGSIEEILIPPSSADNSKVEIEDDRDRLLGKSSLDYYKKYKIREMMIKEGKEVSDISEPEKPWEKSFKVLEEQALLKVKEVSLGTQAAIMLFEGEISKFTIKLENIGTVPITYLKLTINEKYGERRNSNMLYEFADVIYEKEIYEKGKKTFWLQQTVNTGKDEIDRDSEPTNKSDTEIIPINLMPGKECEIVIGTYGNILCSSGSICIKYGNVNFEESDSEDEDPYYYLRQIDIPIMITVQRGLTTLNADMLVFNGNSEADTLRNFRNRKKQIGDEEQGHNKTLADQNDPYISNSLEELLEMVQFEQKINFNKYCLLTFELNNLWNIPFEIKFTIEEEKNSDSIEINVLIDANSTKRIFLPILRYNLPESILSQEIPTPNRQQVAYKIIKLVEHEEKIRKEQFWFKEDLFGGLILGKGKITASWTCSRIRNGMLNLRNLKLTSSMLNILKVKDITFDVCLEPLKSTKEGAIISKGQDGDEISCKLREMVGLKWTINNHLNVPKKVCIRIEPVQDFDNGLLDYHLQGRMAWSGSLQKVLEEIPPNSSIDYILPVYFFSPGHFKFIYHCELVGNIKEHSKNGENIWWGDSPAIIHVV